MDNESFEHSESTEEDDVMGTGRWVGDRQAESTLTERNMLQAVDSTQRGTSKGTISYS